MSVHFLRGKITQCQRCILTQLVKFQCMNETVAPRSPSNEMMEYPPVWPKYSHHFIQVALTESSDRRLGQFSDISVAEDLM